MKMKIVFLICLLQPFILSGCSSLNSNFDCPMKPGVRCENLDQVNAQVDSGQIGHPNTQPISLTSYHQDVTESGSSPYKSMNSLSPGEPLRYGETVMRVWVAPYEDTSGNYHQESDIYTIVKPGHWIGFPPKEISGG